MKARTQRRLAILALLAIAAAVGVAALFFVRQHQKDAIAASAYETGRAAFEAGDYAGALRDLSTYVSRNRGDIDAIVMLAACRSRVPDPNGRHLAAAIAFAEDAVARDRAHVPAHELLMRLYRDVGFATERHDISARLLELDPDHAEAFESLVQAKLLIGKTGAAPGAATFADDGALGAFARWFERHPDDLDAYLQKTLVLRLTDRPDAEIDAHLAALVERFPDEPLANMQRFAHLVNLGQRERAAEVLRTTAGLPISGDTELEAVLAGFDTLVQLARDNDELLALREQADVLVERAAAELGSIGHATAAKRSWKRGSVGPAHERLALVDPADLGAFSDGLLGWSALIAVGMPDGAEEPGLFAAELESRQSGDARQWQDILEATSAFNDGAYERARSALDVSRGFESGMSVALVLTADLELRIGEWRLALDLLRRAITADPTWVAPRLREVKVLRANARTQEAVARAEAALASLDPDGLVTYELVTEWASGLIELAERDAVAPSRLVGAADLLGQSASGELAQRPEFLVLRAGLLAAGGRAAQAEAILRDVWDVRASAGTEAIVALARIAERHALAVPGDPVAFLGAERAGDLAAIQFLASVHVEQGAPGAAIALVRAALAGAAEDERLELELVLAGVLDRADPEAAVEHMRALSAGFADVQSAQRAVLNSSSAWGDNALVARAIDRLRAITGDEAIEWRVQESRRLMSFDPSPEKATEVLVNLLPPVFQADPDHVQAHVMHAQADLAQRVPEARRSAIGHLARAVDLSGRAELYPQLIALLQSEGETDLAERRLIDFLVMDGLDAPLRRARVTLLRRQGMLDDAARELEALVAEEGVVSDHLDLAAVLASRGDFDAAARAYVALRSGHPRDEAVLSQYARFASSRGQQALASELASEVEALPIPESGIGDRAAFFEQLAMLDVAERLLQDARRREATEASDVDYARFLLRQERTEEAVAAARAGLERHPQSSMLAAIRDRLTAEDASSSDLASAAMLAAWAASQGQQEMVAFARVMENAARNAGNPEELIDDLRELTSDYPTFWPAWSVLIDQLNAAQRPRDAIAAAGVATRVMPLDPRPASVMTRLLTSSGDLDAAARAAATWRDRTLADPMEADVALGIVRALQKRHAEAVELFDGYGSAFEAGDASLDRAVPVYAESLIAVGRDAEARALVWPRARGEQLWAGEALRLGATVPVDRPDERRRWLAFAEPLATSGGPAPVARALAFSAWYELASATGITDDFQEAIRASTPIVEAALRQQPVDPRQAQLLAVVATCSEQIGDVERAELLYRASLRAAPDQPLVLNNLAFLLVRAGRASEEAVEFVRRAIRVGEATGLSEGVTVEFFDTLGAAWLQIGDAPQAESAFRAGLALDGRAAHLRLGLARALLDQGKAPDASAELAQALQDGAEAMAAEDPYLRGRLEALQAALPVPVGG